MCVSACVQCNERAQAHHRDDPVQPQNHWESLSLVSGDMMECKHAGRTPLFGSDTSKVAKCL